MDEPKITDWISAIAALIGIGPIIWGIFKLFIKSRDQDDKLKFFEEQVNELRRQTSEYQYQSTLMKEANELVRSQLDLQQTIFTKSQEAEAKKEAIEKNQRKNELRPYFIFSGSGTQQNNFNVRLLNKGGKALNVTIESVNTDFVIISNLEKDLNIDSNQTFFISGHADPHKTYFNSSMVSCQILIRFTDIDGNVYYQNVRKNNTAFSIDPPYEDSKSS